jgi:hypothetical protein
MLLDRYRSLSLSLTHTPGRTPLNEWSQRRRGRYLHNTQQTQEKNIIVLSGIWTRNPSDQAAVDLRLRQYDHRDWLNEHVYSELISTTLTNSNNKTN